MTFNYNYFCHLFVLIYIVYRRFLECILNTKLATYRHYHVIINRFYLNVLLVRTYYYQFGPFTFITFTVQNIILLF